MESRVAFTFCNKWNHTNEQVLNVGADVLEQVRIGIERENTEGRGVVSYHSNLSQDTVDE